jgi:hypothetical protein
MYLSTFFEIKSHEFCFSIRFPVNSLMRKQNRVKSAQRHCRHRRHRREKDLANYFRVSLDG